MKSSEILTREEPKSFTPGPWSVLNNHPKNACVYVTANDGKEIAVLYDGDKCKQDSDGIWSAQPIRDATASLVAAAPDLYEALSAVVSFEASPDFTKWKGVIDRANSALLKARGGSSNEGE